MNHIIELGLLAANGGGGGPGAPGAPGGNGGGGGGLFSSPMMIGLILMLVVFYAVMLSGNRKEKKKRKEMLSAIKKNDRVLTIGGIVGSVVSVDDSEVVLKIDESTNVKMTVTRSAVQKVLIEEGSAEVAK